MIHPFFTKLVTQPGLFAEHVAAYAELATAEVRQFGSIWQTRAILAAITATAMVIAIVLTSIAGMFAAAIAWQGMPAAWVLIAVPALFWLIALGCGIYAWRLKVTPMFSLVREQVAVDIDLLNRAGKA